MHIETRGSKKGGSKVKGEKQGRRGALGQENGTGTRGEGGKWEDGGRHHTLRLTGELLLTHPGFGWSFPNLTFLTPVR